MQVLEQHQFNPGPELVMLLRRIAAAKPDFVRACEAANLQRAHARISEGNHTYFLLEGIEAAFMRAFVGALLVHVKPMSLVFIHDGLLVSPEPSRAHLDSCLHEASLSLGIDPPPGFRVQTANLHHDQSRYQGPSHSHVEVLAQVTSVPGRSKVRKLAPVAPTAETLHTFWSRRSGSYAAK